MVLSLGQLGTIAVDRMAWYLVCLKTSFLPSSRRVHSTDMPPSSPQADVLKAPRDVDVPLLPVGWKARMSRSRNELYYTNKALQLTQWHHPSPGVSLPEGWRAFWCPRNHSWNFRNKELGLRQCVPPTPDDVLPRVPLPPGWKGYKSRRTGNWFFKHSTLQVQQHHYPCDEQEMPDGWKMYVNRHGATYYKNKQLNMTLSDQPTEAMCRTLPTLPDGWKFIQSDSGKWCFVKSARQITDASSWTVPPGWCAKVSRSKGIVYYVNKELRLSQWEHPVVAA